MLRLALLALLIPFTSAAQTVAPPAFWVDALCRKPDPRCHDLIMEIRLRVLSGAAVVPVPYCPPAAADADERDRLDYLRIARWTRYYALRDWPHMNADQVEAAVIGNVMPCGDPPKG